MKISRIPFCGSLPAELELYLREGRERSTRGGAIASMKRLREVERRRAGWVEGEWVRLGEHGEWSFPRPDPAATRAAGGRGNPGTIAGDRVGPAMMPDYPGL